MVCINGGVDEYGTVWKTSRDRPFFFALQGKWSEDQGGRKEDDFFFTRTPHKPFGWMMDV